MSLWVGTVTLLGLALCKHIRSNASRCEGVSMVLYLLGLLRILFSYLPNATANSAFYSKTKLHADKEYADFCMLFPLKNPKL